MNNPLDELFSIVSPAEVDTTSLLRYFKDLERAVSFAVKTIKYSDDTDAIEAIDNISNELSWVESDFHELVVAFNDAERALSVYRDIVEERLTADERYELNTLNVRRKLEASA